MSTTITGQLSLTMLIEELSLQIPRIKWIQANTDGITALVPKTHEELFYKISNEWEQLTKLTLEFAKYSKMAVRDVSNYLAVYEYGDVKLKGCFEIDKEFHKNPSMRIVPIALKNYFVNNIPITTTIENHTDIFDFCLELKTTKDWQTVYKYLNLDTREIISENLGKVTRYYIGGTNGALLKVNKNDERETRVFKEYGIKILNKFKKLDNYNIDYDFYIREANKIINQTEDLQLKLF